MNRRSFLAATAGGGALLAGCLEFDDEPTSETESEPESPTDETSGTNGESTSDAELPAFDDPSVVDFETAPLTAAVVDGRFRTDDGLEVGLAFEGAATEDAPATIVAVVHNGKSYEQRIQSRRLVAFDDPTTGRSDDGETVYLTPAEDHPLAETPPGYERDGDGRWRLEAVGDDWFPETITLAGEETVVGEHYLLGHHGYDDAPIDAGRYDFRWRGNGFIIAVWETDAPGPNGTSTFDGGSVPDLPNEDELAWFHEATPTTEAYLEPDVESVTAPAKVSFGLVNRSRESMGGNPYRWRLYKLEDGEWFPIAPWGWEDPYAAVEPGDVDETALFLYDDDPIERGGERTVGHLGGGRYAYTVDYSRDGETHAALLDLEAPSLEVEPEADAAIEDEGEKVVVELPNYADARRPATVIVTRSDTDVDEVDERLIPEQLPRRPFRGFRNAIPLFDDGVETVRVKTDRGTALGQFGYEEGERRTIAYEGRTFEATGALEDG